MIRPVDPLRRMFSLGPVINSATVVEGKSANQKNATL
jgi:hypothetical protein